MNFHKLIRAFWLYFLRCLLRIWSRHQHIVASNHVPMPSEVI